MIFLKFICLVLAIAYGFCCFGKLRNGQSINSVQIIAMTVGIAGFIIIQLGI